MPLIFVCAAPATQAHDITFESGPDDWLVESQQTEQDEDGDRIVDAKCFKPARKRVVSDNLAVVECARQLAEKGQDAKRDVSVHQKFAVLLAQTLLVEADKSHEEG